MKMEVRVPLRRFKEGSEGLINESGACGGESFW